MTKTALTVAVYIGCIVLANALTANFQFIPVGFGLMAAAGTYMAGLAFLARDLVQDAGGRWLVVLAIGVGALLSVWLSTPQLALASGAAFLVSELADMAVYTPLRRKGWARAVVASNAVGAVVDSVLFLGLAGFPIWAALPGQLVGKAWATLVPVLAVLVVRRVVLRQPVNAEGA